MTRSFEQQGPRGERGRPEAATARDRAAPGHARRRPTAARILALQRAAGNRAVAAVLASGLAGLYGRGEGPTVQRDNGGSESASEVDVTGVSLNHRAVTVPPEAGLGLDADPVPSNATNVTFSLRAGTAAVHSATTIDASTGAITVAADQAGGSVDVVATSNNPAAVGTATLPLSFVQQPTGIGSTSVQERTDAYGGDFTHTFTAAHGNVAGLQHGRVNERFDSLRAEQPWGGRFKLTANPAGSPGWGVDDTGTMTGPDEVTIGHDLDARRLVANASNPDPDETPPASFTMTQHLRAKDLPSGGWSSTNFADVAHVRGVREVAGALKVFVSASGEEVEQDYVGPATYRNLAASENPTTASPPQTGGGAPAGDRTTVQFTADALPDTATKKFSIVERGRARLGCEIDEDTGELRVGEQAGTIRVRVSDGSRRTRFYDQVQLTIQPLPQPEGGSEPGG